MALNQMRVVGTNCASVMCILMQLSGFMLCIQLYRKRQDDFYSILLRHQILALYNTRLFISKVPCSFLRSIGIVCFSLPFCYYKRSFSITRYETCEAVLCLIYFHYTLNFNYYKLYYKLINPYSYFYKSTARFEPGLEIGCVYMDNKWVC